MKDVEELITMTCAQLRSIEVKVELAVGYASNIGEDVLEQPMGARRAVFLSLAKEVSNPPPTSLDKS